MLNIKLIAETRLNDSWLKKIYRFWKKITGKKARFFLNSLDLINHAAKACYTAKIPKVGAKLLDINNQLFSKSHHTTHEHLYFTFSIEGISVSDITFGLHLPHPFYNSDQRSGRFAGAMFSKPDYKEIEKYIKENWGIEGKNLDEVLNYVKFGINIFQENMASGTALAKKLIKAERPRASEKYLEENSSKFAQEQLRYFISTIFPTGFDYTIDLAALFSLQRSAHSPSLMKIVNKMVEAVIKKHPELSFMFKNETAPEYWSPKIGFNNEIIFKPKVSGLTIDIEGFIPPEQKDMFPIDLLFFKPKYMNNRTLSVKYSAEISIATYGQDQRHRTIDRSEPSFTGNFYLPPIARELGLENKAKELMFKWKALQEKIPPTLWTAIAPYGAALNYEKKINLNALFHEQFKRTCWCTQEEIYHLCCLLRKLLGKHKIIEFIAPPCFKTGICAEGGRYCGRDLILRDGGDFFPDRKI